MTDLVQAKWTNTILDECFRSIQRDRRLAKQPRENKAHIQDAPSGEYSSISQRRQRKRSQRSPFRGYRRRVPRPRPRKDMTFAEIARAVLNLEASGLVLGGAVHVLNDWRWEPP